MSDSQGPDTLYSVILARQNRQQEFLQGLKDAGRERDAAFAEAAATGAVTAAAIWAYRRYRARP